MSKLSGKQPLTWRGFVNKAILKLAAVTSTLFLATVAFFFARPSNGHDGSVRPILAVVMSMAVVWGCISIWARVFVYENVGRRPSMKLFPGSRPTDPVDLRAWRWHWHFYTAFVVMMCSGVIIAFSIWLQER